MPTRDVYNLFWFSNKAGRIDHPAPTTRRRKTTLSKKVGFDSIILYPSMMTPEILVGDDPLEVLLLSQVGSLAKIRQQVPLQLKINFEFDATKTANDRALLVDESGELVGPP